LGETTEIEVFLQQNDMTWSAIEETGLMRTLLQLEMDSHRDTVGPPISILRMDKTGAHWLPNNRGVCSDIPRPATAKPAKMKQISKADH
jgi:hypothetical protein